MKARFQWIQGTDNYALWLFAEGPDRRPISYQDGDWVFGEPIREGERLPEPAMKLPHDVFVAIKGALEGGDASRQIEVHRDDAVKVRDRLLTMLENR